jgi:hypothetical protein
LPLPTCSVSPPEACRVPRTQPSKSQVPVMAKHPDEQVAAFRDRSRQAGPYSFVWDALAQKVREGGRTIKRSRPDTGLCQRRRAPRDSRPGRRHRRGRLRSAVLRSLSARRLTGWTASASGCSTTVRSKVAPGDRSAARRARPPTGPRHRRGVTRREPRSSQPCW